MSSATTSTTEKLEPQVGGGGLPSPEKSGVGSPIIPPHAPRTGRLRRLLGPFYFTGVFWYRFHLFGIRILPEPLIRPVVWLFTLVFFLTLGRVRTAVGNNLAHVLGPCGFMERQRRVWRTILTFAWCLSERYEQFVPGKQFSEEMMGEDLWKENLASEAGFVIATAHVGNWELASALSVGRADRTCNIVRERELDTDSQAFIEGLLSKLERGSYKTHFADDNPLMGLELLDALRRGEMVALQGDRPRSGGRTHTVEICGLKISLPIGTAALARSAGVAIVPVFFFREGRRQYKSVVRKPIHVSVTGDRMKALECAVEQLGREIEWAIRESPNEWFCFSDLTK